jgi:hypothetical protein
MCFGQGVSAPGERNAIYAAIGPRQKATRALRIGNAHGPRPFSFRAVAEDRRFLFNLRSPAEAWPATLALDA